MDYIWVQSTWNFFFSFYYFVATFFLDVIKFIVKEIHNSLYDIRMLVPMRMNFDSLYKSIGMEKNKLFWYQKWASNSIVDIFLCTVAKCWWNFLCWSECFAFTHFIYIMACVCLYAWWLVEYWMRVTGVGYWIGICKSLR